MNAMESLLKEHNRLRKKLSDIAENLSSAVFGQMVREFIVEYQRHEESEESLFRSFIQSSADTEDLWPLRGYRNVHGGAKALLKELQWVIQSGHALSIQRAFTNFHLLALSHFEYEENWIFPLIGKELQEELQLEADHPLRGQGSYR